MENTWQPPQRTPPERGRDEYEQPSEGDNAVQREAEPDSDVENARWEGDLEAEQMEDLMGREAIEDEEVDDP